MKYSTTLSLSCIAVVLAAGSAWAVRPAAWVDNTEAKFASGKFDSTVSTSLGEIRLARETHVLAGSKTAPAVVSCVARTPKTLFVGAGDKAEVYRLAGDKLVKHAELPAAMIACLVPSGHDLLVGTGGGEKPGLWRVDAKGKATCIWSDPKVKYVWALVPAEDGWYVATGPEGKVYAVDAKGHGRVIYEVGDVAKNILCLVQGPKGKLYAGTGDEGLVIEVDPKAKTGRVLYDTPEKEVASLIVEADGSLLAATSDASKASPDGGRTPSTVSKGKAVRATAPATTKPHAHTEAKHATTKPAETHKPAAKPDDKGHKPGDDGKPARPGKAASKAHKPKGAIDPDDLNTSKPMEVSAGSFDAASAAAPARLETADVRDIPAEAARPATLGPRPDMPEPRVIQTALAVPSGVRIVRVPSSRSSSSSSSSKGSASPESKGNAVYRIGTDGLVDTIFRKPVTILAMAEADGMLILATGNGGGIYSVTSDGDEVALIADTDAKQVTCLDVDAAGEITFGTANKGSVARLGDRFAKKGTYVSKAMDAQQIAKWGTVQIAGRAPAGTKVTIATRSGNVREPDDKLWSSWSKEQPLESGYLPIGAPAGRFLQYRLTLTAGKAAESPSVSGVQIIYQVGNIAPTVAGVIVVPSEKGPSGNEPAGSPKAFRLVGVKAADQNGDKLQMTISFREVGTRGWVTLTDDLKSPKYIWDTRTVNDGTYELRVEVSDDLSNPAGQALSSARISDPFVVDNTAPTVKVTAKTAGRNLTITGQADDATSRIVEIEYSVNSQDDWNAVAPSDGICDSGSEKFGLRVEALKPGNYRIAVKATDLYGNVGYGAANVTIGK